MTKSLSSSPSLKEKTLCRDRSYSRSEQPTKRKNAEKSKKMSSPKKKQKVKNF